MDAAADLLKTAAKWKMRVQATKTDENDVLKAFGREGKKPASKSFFSGGSRNTSSASVPEDPALQMAMKWKSKSAPPLYRPPSEAEQVDPRQQRKNALVAAAAFADSVTKQLHGCDILCETLKELMKKPAEVSRTDAGEWAALTRLLRGKGLQKEVDQLGDLVIDLRKANEYRNQSFSDAEPGAAPKPGQGLITTAIQADSMRQIDDTRKGIASRVQQLEAQSVCDDDATMQRYQEEAFHLNVALTELNAAVLRLKYRSECMSGILGHKYASGWDPEVDAVSTIPLQDQLNGVVRELSRLTRSEDKYAVVMGSFGVTEAIEISVATELLHAAGAWDCYVTAAPIPKAEYNSEEEDEEEVKKPKEKAIKSFHTENSAISAIIGRGKRKSVSEVGRQASDLVDPATECPAVNLASGTGRKNRNSTLVKPAAPVKPVAVQEIDPLDKDKPSDKDMKESLKIAAEHDKDDPKCECKHCIIAKVYRRSFPDSQTAALATSVFSFSKQAPAAVKANNGGGFRRGSLGSGVRSRAGSRSVSRSVSRSGKNRGITPAPQSNVNVAEVGFGFGDVLGCCTLETHPVLTRTASAVHDHYWTVLGLQPGVSDAELKRAYRTLAAECHPDRFAMARMTDSQAQADAAHKFTVVGEAYRVLKDYELRKVYESGGAGAVQQYESDQARMQNAPEMKMVSADRKSVV